MQIIRDLDSCPRPPVGTVVTIGAYDGVHRGHVAVIERVKRLAAADGMASAVVTFDRHPASVVRPESAPRLLTDLDQKLELLEQTGIDWVLVVRFDEARSHETAEDFVRDELVGCLNAKVVVVGEDFHFGHRRAGNVDLLRTMGTELGFVVSPLELVGTDGLPASDDADRVSSTSIRRALDEGDLARANDFLGRPHEVRGTVGHGDQRARDLGFPTANVAVRDDTCLPCDGIYAGWFVGADGEPRAGAISLGRRPTFYDHQPFSLLEVHLLDWSGDLYDQHVAVRFVARLRDERRFDGVDALVAQMATDCDDARRVLGI